MTQVDMVKQICKERNISIHKLEMDLGFSNGYISQLKKGVFPADRAMRIAKYLNLTIDYMMNKANANVFDQQDIIHISDEAKEVALAYDNLPDDLKQVIRTMLKYREQNPWSPDSQDHTKPQF